MTTIPDFPKDLFPTEYAEYLVDWMFNNFENFVKENNEMKLLQNEKLTKFRLIYYPDYLNKLINTGMLSLEHEKGLIKQMASPDSENWLMALSITKQLTKD